MLSPRRTARSPLLRLRPLALTVSAALSAMCAPAAFAAAALDEAPVPDGPVQVVTITGSADHAPARVSNAAAKLDLSLRETPQSVTVISRERMDDFKLDNVNDVLAGTTGVSVERVETDRTYYTARGFDITNFQYDGVGMPMVFGNVNGDLDTALYERIDVVRGANGLTSSTGNPSATINFIRKRPLAGTRGLQASAALTLGSWDQRRVEADVSTALNASGTVRGRAVAVHHDTDSWLDRYQLKKTVGYAVVDARLGEATVLTAGHLRQANKTRGGMWGALPLSYSDGSPTDYDVSTSTSADWSRWDTTTSNTFAELTHRVGAHWTLRAVAGHTDTNSDSKLEYVYGTPTRGTELGLYSYPSMYASKHRQSQVDLSASGKINLGGRAHDLMFGAQWSRSRLDDQSFYGRGIGTGLTPATAFGGAYPEPLFDARIDGSSYQDRRKTAYAAARWNLSERLKVLTGANWTDVNATGLSYGLSKATSPSKTTPYVGIVWDTTPSVSLYTSYTGIFNPQSETGRDGQPLAPVEGSNLEVGFKMEPANTKLALSGALFRARQQNLAEQDGMSGTKAWYRGINAESTGAEVELSGELARGWNATLGYTVLSMEDEKGERVKTYVPRRLLRMATTWRPEALPQWKFGATLNWQDDIHRDEGDGLIIRQASYALLGLMAQYTITDKLHLSINVNNATDRKHLTSLYWSQAYYGAPRNASATLNWSY